MKLTFLGTLGSIEERSARHRRHSALLIEREGQRVMIDCGLGWDEELSQLAPQAILLTHGHDDHVGGLQKGAPCPVYAGTETWPFIETFPLRERHTVTPGVPLFLAGLRFTAVAVLHSLRAPALGYRVEDGSKTLFYLPDVAALPDPQETLEGVDLYIGDGAAGSGSLLRVEEGELCGHAPLATQMNWCRKAGVPRMLITHCGTELVAEKTKGTASHIAALAAEFGVSLAIAHDGLQLPLS